MYRYLAIVWDPRCPDAAGHARTAVAAATSSPSRWASAHIAPGVVVLHTLARRGTAGAIPLARSRGAVLGNLFSNGRGDRAARACLALTDDEADRIVRTRGQHLVEAYWGSYVAIILDSPGGTCYVLRDPIGHLPCFHFQRGAFHLLFSNLADCVDLLPEPLSVNERYLARWLVFSAISSGECGLKEIEEVPGGERLALKGAHCSRTKAWNPIEIASKPCSGSIDDAAKELRATVQNTVDAWAGCYRNITLNLSGGLDSSIVAGCLAQVSGKLDLTFVNQVVDLADRETLHLPGVDPQIAAKIRAISGHGDERHFARLVADRWGIPLTEMPRDLAMDLRDLWQAPLMTSPALLFTMMDIETAKVEFLKAVGTEAFFSGQGGDCVLFASFQPYAAMDHAYVHGVTRLLWRHVADSSRLSGDSVWSVLRKTVMHGLLRRRYKLPLSILDVPTLLRPELAACIEDSDFDGPMGALVSSARLPPGKRQHVASATGSAFSLYVFESGRHADHVDPLNSQPVWELMLRIPTYTLLANGISRGLARRAFADLLPDEIRRRRMKGTGTPYYQHIVRRNLGLLRERLLDGRLVRDGYLDRTRVLEYFSREDPFMSVSAAQILSYLAAEIWLQHLTERRRRIAA